MKILNIVAFALLAAVSAVSSLQLWRLRSEVAALSSRVKSLSLELSSVEQASRAPTPAIAPVVLRAGEASVRPAGSSADERVRELVGQELAKRDADEKATVDAHLELLSEQTRDTLTLVLALNDAEFDEFDRLSVDLAASERALVEKRDSGSLSETDAHAQYEQAWQTTDASLKRVLGEARYGKLAALRLQHPEFARSFAVLRAPPGHKDEIAGNRR